MPDSADIFWFKTQFESPIQAAIAGTPLTVDFLTAIACHETGSIWGTMRRKDMAVDRIVALCVGDTLDADKGRAAFPLTRADLEKAPRGKEMFAIARQALVDMAQHVPGYEAVAKRPNKFCHGFGVFQLDLQFFIEDPEYFLNRDYEKFDCTLDRCVRELKSALRKLDFQSRVTLTDQEFAMVSIVYNTGRFKPAKGLKQGHFDGKRFYGEAILDFIRLAHTVAIAGEATALLPAPAGQALVAPPSPVTATGPALRVETREGMLRLRREPYISTPPQANVVGHLPDGHEVRAITGAKVGGFIEVETSLSGALLRGFASAKFLQPLAGPVAIQPVVPAALPPNSGIVAVTMPRKPGSITRRRDPANAHSLNENGQPGRVGTSPDQLRAELAAIVDWLAVDDKRNLRYQPHDGLTFCNIYAHDYCYLADVFLPRVWWSAPALLRLAAGETVQPLIGNTIAEMRANDLFRWLRDFGAAFGWRQTGTLTKLQTEVNLGAIGLIVARRKEDGRSGHIVMVVPETGTLVARRNAAGEVIAPLQSQAGASNFRQGTGKLNWWNGEQFAESAFWLHA
ncbi:hypothetical protein [Crenobacter cavernae]|uniref:SH3 domain-containing protein n=1 Tax=Crenobacter cavernae TaxID=2290923 RepID=A0A345Y8D4_9NEIS|nr:hypothetical protein [Crenobacter cavernae]AXK40186.1 hypothetical protein DWG20_12440 [Crenobacter cavernae]